MSEVDDKTVRLVVHVVNQLKEEGKWKRMTNGRWREVAKSVDMLGVHGLSADECKEIYGASKLKAAPAADDLPRTSTTNTFSNQIFSDTDDDDDDDDNSSQLLLAVAARNAKEVERLLQVKDIDVNVRDEDGWSPLYQACLNKDLRIVILLLAVPKIKVNLSCLSDGTTPLHVACKSDSGIVEQLLRNEDINVNLLTTKGLTALYVACEYGVPSNVQHLVEAAGILVNQTQSANGWTPLIAACDKGDKNAQSDHLSCIEILLGAPGIDVNQPLTSGATALYIACRRKHLEAIHLLLLAPNIDINKAKKNGKTPLYIACKKGNWDIVVLLLMFDEIQVDEAEWELIINVMQYPVTRQNEIAKIIENKLDENKNNLKMLLVFGPYNSSFFYKACNQNLPKIVTALSARKDVNVNQPFDRPHGTGTTPLTEAIPSLELVRILLKCEGINVNQEDGFGWTPLIKACMANSIGILRELLQTRDIQVNLKSTDSGDTALHYACGAHQASTEIVSMLLKQREINVNKPSDQGGKTPLIMAIMSGRLDKVKLLMERREINMSETRGDNTVRMKTPLFWAFYAVDEYGMQSLRNFEVLNFMMGMIKKYPRLMSDLPYFLNRSILKFCSANGDVMNYIDSNFYALAKSILEYPIGLNYYSEQETPLTAVCKHVNVDIVSHIKLCAQFVALLLSNPKVDINKKTMGDPESALHIACRRGLLPIVEMLVARQDVKVNDSNVWGATALFLVCNTETRSEDISPASLGIVRSLLTRTDIRINKSVKMTRFNDVKSSWTPLHEACSNPRKLNLVKLLLSDSRIDVDIRTSTGNTALHMAVLCNSYDIVRVLIGYFEDNNSHKKRGRINQANNTGHNAIDLAVQKDFTNIGVLLAENGGVQSLPQAMQQQLKKRALTASAIGNTIRRTVQRPVDADGRIATKIVSMLGNNYRKRSTLIF